MTQNATNPGSWSPHHYAFAHGALRDLSVHLMSCIFSHFTKGPKRTIQARIRKLLKATDALVEDTAKCHYDVSDFKFTRHSYGDAPCLVVEMPEPQEPGEAYFVAIVSRISEIAVESQELEFKIRGGPGLHKHWLLNYYTLERSPGYAGGAKSFFCEWDAQGRHINHCRGPEGTVGEFLPFLKDFVVQRAIREGRDPVSMSNSI
jgi:hypothetical protein